jgi:TonB family protein
MKKLFLPVLLSLTCLGAFAKDPASRPVTMINLRGEQLPLFAFPQARKKGAPQYPKAELATRTSGKAVLIMLVGEDGKVVEVEVSSSVPSAAFGEAARAAALKWRFEPLTYNGKPTRFLAQQELVFSAPSAVPASLPQIEIGVRSPDVESFGRN